MARDHIFVADVTGDAAPEVISEIDGTWNRVTVWDLEGAPLYNAQFGAGTSTPFRNMRDVDLVDLDGNGRPEIVAATWAGTIVALDGECGRLWSAQLPSPPTVLEGVGGGTSPAALVVGCEDGTVLAMNAAGAITRRGGLADAPTRIAEVPALDGVSVVVGTAGGEVATFRP